MVVVTVPGITHIPVAVTVAGINPSNRKISSSSSSSSSSYYSYNSDRIVLVPVMSLEIAQHSNS